MSDTPRTDYAATLVQYAIVGEQYEVVTAEFSRVLERELARLREATIEECAKVAESVGRPAGASDGSTYIPGTSGQAAAAIRALKGKP